MSKKKLTRKEKFAQSHKKGEDTKQQQVPKQPGNIKLILGLIIAAICFLLYVNSLGHEFVLDDSNAITENHIVKQGVEGIPTLLNTSYRSGYWRAEGTLYRPLSLIMFATEWELFPNDPFPGHLINVLLYSLTGFLLFIVLTMMLKGYNIVIPFAISLLFLAHPIHTEVVANIKSRDEIMSFLLVLLSFFLLFKFIATKSTKHLVIGVLCYFVAFLSKESAITMLAVVPLMLFYFTDVDTKSNIRVTGAFLAGAIGYLILRKLILGGVSGVENVLLIDNFLVGAEDEIAEFATAMLILGKYLLLLIIPHPLSIDYAYNQIPITSFGDYKVWLSLVAYLAMAVVAIMRFKKKELWVFGIIFYLVTMSLYSNIFITIGSAFGERFLYVPSLGFCITIVSLVAMGLKTAFKETSSKSLSQVFNSNKAIMAFAVVITTLYSVKTVARSWEWRDHYTIYEAGVKAAPNSARLRYWHGNEIMKDKALKATNDTEKIKFIDEAIAQYDIALNIYSDYGDAYGQRGLAYYRRGNKEKAVENYKKAISLSVGQAKVYNNLAVIYGEEGNFREALRVLKQSLQVEDRYPDAHKNIGSSYLMLKEYDNAIAAYKESLKYLTAGTDKYRADVYNYLGICYANKGDEATADKYFKQAKQLNPALNTGIN